MVASRPLGAELHGLVHFGTSRCGGAASRLRDSRSANLRVSPFKGQLLRITAAAGVVYLSGLDQSSFSYPSLSDVATSDYDVMTEGPRPIAQILEDADLPAEDLDRIYRVRIESRMTMGVLSYLQEFLAHIGPRSKP